MGLSRMSWDPQNPSTKWRGQLPRSDIIFTVFLSTFYLVVHYCFFHFFFECSMLCEFKWTSAFHFRVNCLNTWRNRIAQNILKGGCDCCVRRHNLWTQLSATGHYPAPDVTFRYCRWSPTVYHRVNWNLSRFVLCQVGNCLGLDWR